MPFGPKSKSPKATEKKAAERENGALMCDSGGEVSPKAGPVGGCCDISTEHEIHALNGKSPGDHITGALVRENLCFRLFGGGDVPSTTIVSGFLSSPKEPPTSLYHKLTDQWASAVPSRCDMSNEARMPTAQHRATLPRVHRH